MPPGNASVYPRAGNPCLPAAWRAKNIRIRSEMTDFSPSSAHPHTAFTPSSLRCCCHDAQFRRIDTISGIHPSGPSKLELNMNWIFHSLPARTLIYSALVASAVLSVSAQGAEPDYRFPGRFACTNETLKGTYGFTLTGLRPTGPGAPQVAVVGTALTTFHGDGMLDQFDNINVNSPAVPFQANRPGSGTYNLEPDCSGTMTLTAGGMTLNLSIVVVDHGREVRTAVITPNVIVTSNGRKID